jgi:hypothetical protein
MASYILRNPLENKQMTTKNTTKRYIPTRVVADKRASKRYQRSGWLVFDTRHPISSHLFVNTRQEAKSIADSRNSQEGA